MLTSLLLLTTIAAAPAQDADPGRKVFETRCARCHGADGNGGEMGPPIVLRLGTRDDQQLASFIREGLPPRGMPPSAVPDAEMGALIKFLRTIERRAEPLIRRSVRTTDGK